MGFVYFIKDESGRTKIGSSIDPENRLKQLQTSCADRLTLIGSIKSDEHKFIEKKIHKQLKDLRISGEWFGIARAVVEDIIASYERVDIADVEHTDSKINDLQQVQLAGLYIVPDAKYTTLAVVTECEYSSISFYVTEISTGKGFQYNTQYQIDEVPSYWRKIERETMPF